MVQKMMSNDFDEWLGQALQQEEKEKAAASVQLSSSFKTAVMQRAAQKAMLKKRREQRILFGSFVLVLLVMLSVLVYVLWSYFTVVDIWRFFTIYTPLLPYILSMLPVSALLLLLNWGLYRLLHRRLKTPLHLLSLK